MTVSTQNSGDDLSEAVDDIQLALNGLRREHRDLKETVEDEVLDYIEGEQAVLEDIGDYIDAVADLKNRVEAIDDRQQRLADRVERLETETDNLVTREELDDQVADVEAEHQEAREDLTERVKQLETRVSVLAERED
ncbi:MAG: hypothetical protein SVY41_00490 [Candidatus Nanohaloarchaea archaeon]|nr:hypothetical protein [Candidatus Nanohaloarchaea archaeon]